MRTNKRFRSISQNLTLGRVKVLAIAGILILWNDTTLAQIVPDSSTPTNLSISGCGTAGTCNITGGAQQGSNLFHSFGQFDISQGAAVLFVDPGVENILSRVTGGNPSNIFGTLGVQGPANLFFLNPNGIIFGPNASLNLQGSFVGSTASSIIFADGTQFSATNPSGSLALTISTPIGLQFGNAVGDIRSQGAILQVQPGKTLALAGGNLNLEGGFLNAPGGRLELGSVGRNNRIGITPVSSGFALEYAGIQNFQDIQLTRGVRVAANEPGGTVTFQARRVSASEGSRVSVTTFASGDAGDLVIRATDSIELSGAQTAFFGQVASGARGNGGDVTLETGRLTLRDGARVSTSTLGMGNAGNLTVRATDSVELSSPASSLVGEVNSGATGNGGNLTVETGRLLIQNGATLSTSTSGIGNAGNLIIRASESVRASGEGDTGPQTGIFATVSPGAVGKGGSLTIEVDRLTVENGGQVSTTTASEGDAGDLAIRASSVELLGSDPDTRSVVRRWNVIVQGNQVIFVPQPITIFPTGIFARVEGGKGSGGNITLNTDNLAIRNNALISVTTFSEGNAGNLLIRASEKLDLDRGGLFARVGSGAKGDGGDIRIVAGEAIVQNGSVINVSSEGGGVAGDIEITARSLQLNNRGAILAENVSGNGGNISLNVQNLLQLRRNSLISTTAGTASAGGDGGNIAINANFVLAPPQENSDIIANAFTGRGGNIQIAAQSIFGLQKQPRLTSRSDIVASSALGINGTVILNIPDFDISKELTEFPEEIADISQPIQRGCQRFGESSPSKFTIKERDSLPSNPVEILEGGIRQEITASRNAIVEARGWLVDPQNRNRRFLRAQAPNPSFIAALPTSNVCSHP